MTSVFRVVADVNNYQFVATDESAFTSTYPFDGTRIGRRWTVPCAFVYNPVSALGDFLGCFWLDAVFAVHERARRQVAIFMDQACEVLPLVVDDHRLNICNVTNVVNCLDVSRSIIDEDTNSIERYAFVASRFNYSLFKIPQSRQSEILCVEGIAAPLDEFKGRVEKLGLTGLRFQKLWTDGVE